MKPQISALRLVALAFLALGAATLLLAATGVITPELEGRQESDREDHPDEAFKFRRLQLQDENGKIPADGLLRARAHMEVMKAAQAARAAGHGKPEGETIASLTPASWTWIGPGNVGGRIRSIVIDPNNANKMWVGSVGGGIWRSTDAGASWAPVNDFMANLAVSTMVMDPTNSNIMYAGTGELFSASQLNEGENISADGLRGLGVFKSTDGGLTWSQLPNTNPANTAPGICGGIGGTVCPWSYIQRLAISPDGSTILAATVNGIKRSTDGGATWTTPAGLAGAQLLDTDFDPTTGIPPANQKAITSGYGAAYYSTDGGQTWSGATFTPTIFNSLCPPNFCFPRVEVAYAPSNPNIVYAAVDQNKGQLYQSLNGGQSYSQVSNGVQFFQGAGDQGGYDNIVWVNPLDPTFVIVGGIDLWLSPNCGAFSCPFTQISNWLCGPGQPTTGCSGQSAHADQHMIVAHPAFNNTTNKIAYFSNDGGLFRADDVSTVTQTTGWTSLNNNLGITQFYAGAGNGDSGRIMGGAQDNGTVTYTGSTQGWVTARGGDGGFCAADPTDPNYFYGEYTGGTVFRSSNGAGSGSGSYIYCDPTVAPQGGSYVCNSPTGLRDAANGANFIAPLVLDPGNASTMLVGGLSLWRSTDIKSTAAIGPTWATIQPPRPTAGGANNPISAIAISPSDSSTILVGYNDGQIWLTQNGSANSPSWSKISAAPLPGRFVTRVVIDNTRGVPWLYATFGGFSADNIFRSKDLGATWTLISGSDNTALPAVPVRSLVINQVNPNFLYVGTELGLFASEDAGATWQLPQGGPANVSVDDLFWLKGNLIAVTHGRGMYSTIMPVSTLPECAFSGTCGCRGDWNCACSWPSNHVPGPNDDVEITCPITVSQGATCKNLRVNGHLTLTGGNLTVSGTLINEGLIDVAPGMQNGINGQTLINLREKNAVGPKGQIAVQAIGMTGDVVNTGFITLADSFSCNNLTNAAIDGSLGSNSLTALGVTVRGDIFNNAIINARGISISNPGPSVHNLSGIGQWLFTESLSAGETTQLANDMTFNGGAVSIVQGGTFKLQDHNLVINGLSFDNNNGTLSLGAGNLLFTGTDHFNTSNASGGSVTGTGTITLQPSGGSVVFGDNNQFQPNLRIAFGVITSTAIFVGGNLTIDPGATLSLNGGTHTVNGNIALQGSVTKTASGNTFVFNGQNFLNTGSFISDFTTFNNSGSPRQQTINGNGTWQAGTSMAIGGGTGSTSTTKLLSDVTMSQANFAVGQGSTLDLQTFNFTYAGGRMANSGQVIGTGKFKMAPSSGTATLIGANGSNYSSEFRIASGVITATSGNVLVSGPLNVDFGSTLAITNGAVVAGGPTATINGTLSGGGFSYVGNGTFTNAGSIIGTFLDLSPTNILAPPVVQQLAGSGTWTSNNGRLYIDARSTVTLASDVAYTGPTFYLDSRLDTGVYTFTLPCTTAWQGSGEIVGNVRRTNLSACGGAVAYGSPFTTIVFTGGTPPTEVTVKVTLGPPAGFPNAVQRTYQITPTGGSGYTATLRLHYLDSELNGNNESTMQLYRNNGTSWNAQGASARDTVNNWVEYNNVTQFSPWTLSSLTPPPPPTPTVSPTPSVTPTATPVQTPAPTPTPTPPPGVHITGTVFYCSNSPSAPASNVTLTVTGGAGGSAVTDSSGNYDLSVGAGGSYTVTPSKAALAPGSNGINTIDVVATQRHFLNVTAIPPGCRLTAADVNGDLAVNTIDVVAIQRFFIGQTAGSANVGKYQFSPANRTYSGIGSNQSGQDFNALVFGDVVSPFVQRPEGSTLDAADDSAGDLSRPKVATVALPDITSELNRTAEVTTSRITPTDNLVGFQGDFTFDSNALTFENEPVQKAGLTAGNWNVAGNVLPGFGTMRTLRVSGYSTDFTPLSGEGALFELKLSQVNKTDQGIRLIWAVPPDDFFFIDTNLNIQRPDHAAPGVSRQIAK